MQAVIYVVMVQLCHKLKVSVLNSAYSFGQVGDAILTKLRLAGQHAASYDNIP